MRRFWTITVAVVCICSLTFADDQAKATAPEVLKVAPAMTSDHLNNVIMMDATGSRTALCACEKEFQVTDKSPTILRGDEADYCCTPGCHEMFMSASKEAQDKMMSEYWKSKFPFDKMATNVTMKDSKKVATCLCGNPVEVTDKTPKVTENGITMYLCSDACATALHGMTAKVRMDKELAMMKTLPKAEMKADKQQ